MLTGRWTDKHTERSTDEQKSRQTEKQKAEKAHFIGTIENGPKTIITNKTYVSGNILPTCLKATSKNLVVQSQQIKTLEKGVKYV